MRKNFNQKNNDTTKFPPSEVAVLTLSETQENLDELFDIITANPTVFTNFTIPVQIERKLLSADGKGRVSIGKILSCDESEGTFDVLIYGKFVEDIRNLETSGKSVRISVGVNKSPKRDPQITYFNIITE
jgi:hypothetical protein